MRFSFNNFTGITIAAIFLFPTLSHADFKTNDILEKNCTSNISSLGETKFCKIRTAEFEFLVLEFEFNLSSGGREATEDASKGDSVRANQCYRIGAGYRQRTGFKLSYVSNSWSPGDNILTCVWHIKE